VAAYAKRGSRLGPRRMICAAMQLLSGRRRDGTENKCVERDVYIEFEGLYSFCGAKAWCFFWRVFQLHRRGEAVLVALHNRLASRLNAPSLHAPTSPPSLRTSPACTLLIQSSSVFTLPAIILLLSRNCTISPIVEAPQAGKQYQQIASICPCCPYE
jgi:hypothetical protein